ncbi:MAG: ribose 5-phosphate isomerase A [Waddliaceae bacterium]
MTTIEKAKKLAAEKALSFVKPGMQIGLGTGSTVKYFLEALGHRCLEGLNITGIPTSIRSEELAKKHHIPISRNFTEIDLTIDGADAVDPSLNLIKGRGGALLREKIIAYSSKQMIVIVDDSKMVSDFSGESLPLEVLPFGWESTKYAIEKHGFTSNLRTENGKALVSDNGNYTIDLNLPSELKDLQSFQQLLGRIPGILETGLFLNFATKVICGSASGKVTEIKG